MWTPERTATQGATPGPAGDPKRTVKMGPRGAPPRGWRPLSPAPGQAPDERFALGAAPPRRRSPRRDRRRGRPDRPHRLRPGPRRRARGPTSSGRHRGRRACASVSATAAKGDRRRDRVSPEPSPGDAVHAAHVAGDRRAGSDVVGPGSTTVLTALGADGERAVVSSAATAAASSGWVKRSTQTTRSPITRLTLNRSSADEGPRPPPSSISVTTRASAAAARRSIGVHERARAACEEGGTATREERQEIAERWAKHPGGEPAGERTGGSSSAGFQGSSRGCSAAPWASALARNGPPPDGRPGVGDHRGAQRADVLALGFAGRTPPGSSRVDSSRPPAPPPASSRARRAHGVGCRAGSPGGSWGTGRSASSPTPCGVAELWRSVAIGDTMGARWRLEAAGDRSWGQPRA